MGFAAVSSTVISVVLSPFIIFRGLFNQGWRRSLPERFAFGAWNNFKSDGDNSIIWIHAASVGEIAGVASIISALKSELPNLSILISTMTETGKAEAQRRKLSDKIYLFPIDNIWLARRVLRKVRPKLLIIAETELWPSFLSVANEELNIPIVIVNGRISDFSYPRYKLLRWYFSPLMKKFDYICCQTDRDRQRFVELGALSEVTVVCGSAKYDLKAIGNGELNMQELADSFFIDRKNPCFVAGSVREGEEEIVIRVFKALRDSFKDLQLIIAPRYPERYEAVAIMLRTSGIDFYRRSEKGKQIPTGNVLLLDSMGELIYAYAVGNVAFVGGTLVNAGGHNPLEPASVKCPIVVGPYTSNVKDIVDQLRRGNGICEVKSESELYDSMYKLLSDRTRRENLGEAAFRIWQNNNGATEKIIFFIKPYLDSISNRRVHNV